MHIGVATHETQATGGIYPMSNWNMGSPAHPDGTRDVVIAFANNDATGQVGGTLTFFGHSYQVYGNWAAAGSIPGRNFSAFALWGTDNQGATQYIAATGTMAGPGPSPQAVQLNLIRVQTESGQQYGWDGKLLPL
jgi:hypothetical protein